MKTVNKNQFSIPNEIWKVIPSFQGYEASDYGRVRNINTKHILSHMVDKDGYLRVGMSDRNRTPKYIIRTVHRLVAEAFIGDSGGLQVNHLNRVKGDNRPNNLEYCTPSQNIKHSFITGRKDMKGKSIRRRKYTDEQILEVKRLSSLGFKSKHIAILLDVNLQSVNLIKSGRQWGSLNPN